MRVLYVEDNPTDIDLAVRHFKRHASDVILDTVRSQAEALKIIMRHDFYKYDLVLTDMHLRDGDGIAILSHIRGNSIPVAVVILTGQGDERAAVAALKAGADDYVVKKSGFLGKLPGLLKGAYESHQNTQNREVQQLHALYVEHNQADVDLAQRHFAKHVHHINLDTVTSVAKFYEVLEQEKILSKYDVLLLDYRLPQENALEILRKIKRSFHSRIPVILITGKGDEEIAVKALKMGAFDYVTKDQGYLVKLPSVIENAHYNERLMREHEALIESEKRYRALFEMNHVAMLLIDPVSGDIIDANPASASFYGWSRQALTEKKIFDINTLNPKEIEQEMRAASQEHRNYFQFKHRQSNGSVKDVEVYSGPIEIGGQKLLYSIIYDISNRIKAEADKQELQKQLIQAQKMEAVGQLAGGIAHDFNNILSSVLGFTELALDNVPKGSLAEDNLQEVYLAGKRAKDLVAQILTFARQSDEKLSPIRVDLIVKEALGFLRSSIPTTIEIKSKIDSISRVMGNQTQVHQILMNLCTNASHAMEEKGGILTVSLKDISFKNHITGEPSDSEHGNYIEITVSDTGTGIPPEIIDSIFDPYFTTKEPGEGTGMGLAMVKGIVESYGGKIQVESVLESGTTFTIYIPVTSHHEKEALYEPKRLPQGSERILFVDDEAPIAKLGGQILSGLGYQVKTMTNPVETLKLFRSRPGDFDLVVSDMTMPNMTGDKLAGEMIKIRPDIPIILCTGYSKKITDENASEIGIKAFAYKPIVKADLAKIVRRVLDEAKGIEK